MNRTKLITVSLLLLAAAAERVIAKEAALWNFAPVGAMALFCGTMLGRKWYAFLLPLVSLVISDAVMAAGSDVYAKYLTGGGFIKVYASFMLVTLLGTFFYNRIKVLNLTLASLSGSVLFFLVSNFFEWTGSTTYSQDFSGLILCYDMAIPFFKNTLISDLIFNTALFGGYYLLSLRMPSLREA